MAKLPHHEESTKIAHLAMVQGVISRMAGNSFTLKALSVTLGSATIAVSATAENLSPCYVLVTAVPIILFWNLDARYLRYERAYIELYDYARKGTESSEYSLDMRPFLKNVDSVCCTARSWSLSRFYLAPLIIVLVLTMLKLEEKYGIFAYVV